MEPTLLRLFVGLRVGAEARSALEPVLARLGQGDAALKTTHPRDLHLTLAFLGATPSERVPAVAGALEPVAARTLPIDVRYTGRGAFPDARAPRVLWAGVEEERTGALAGLAAEVGEALAPLGHVPESRRFHAHITLARVRPGSRIAAPTRAWLADGLGGLASQRQGAPDRLSVLKIMVSLTDPMGYAYNDLTDLPLMGRAGR